MTTSSRVPTPLKPRDAHWRRPCLVALSAATQLAAHLIAVPQICDAERTREPRLPGESRADFVARVTGVPA